MNEHSFIVKAATRINTSNSCKLAPVARIGLGRRPGDYRVPGGCTTTPVEAAGSESSPAAVDPRTDRFRDSAFDWGGRAAIAIYFGIVGASFLAFAVQGVRGGQASWGSLLGAAAIGTVAFAIGAIALSGRVWVASLIALPVVVLSLFNVTKPTTDVRLEVAFAWLTVAWPLLRLLARRKQVLWPARSVALLLVLLVIAAAPSRLAQVHKRLGTASESKKPAASLAESVGRDVAQMQFQKADGTPLLLDTPGKLYLVDFWEEHCRPCIVELPELVRLHQEGAASGRFELVSVLVNKRPEDLATLPQQLRIAGDQLGAYDDWKAILEHL